MDTAGDPHGPTRTFHSAHDDDSNWRVALHRRRTDSHTMAGRSDRTSSSAMWASSFWRPIVADVATSALIIADVADVVTRRSADPNVIAEERDRLPAAAGLINQ